MLFRSSSPRSSRAREDLGELEPLFARGEFAPLLDWLRRHIHSQGARLRPRDLVRRVTGSDPQAHHLIRHLTRKCTEAES